MVGRDPGGAPGVSLTPHSITPHRTLSQQYLHVPASSCLSCDSHGWSLDLFSRCWGQKAPMPHQQSLLVLDFYNKPLFRFTGWHNLYDRSEGSLHIWDTRPIIVVLAMHDAVLEGDLTLYRDTCHSLSRPVVTLCDMSHSWDPCHHHQMM